MHRRIKDPSVQNKKKIADQKARNEALLPNLLFPHFDETSYIFRCGFTRLYFKMLRRVGKRLGTFIHG